jgi:ketosteroid isomerase-like protein
MRLLLSILLTAAFAFADDVSTVRELVEKFNSAAKAGDEATLKTLLAEGLVYVHSNGLTETKAQCIAAIAKGKPNFVFSPGWTVHVDGKTAIVHAKAVNNPGAANAISLDLMQVWNHDGKSWKMLARHTGRPPAP